MRSHEELVDAIYRALLRRAPDPVGGANAIQALDRGMDVAAYIEGVLTSGEYLKKRARREAMFTSYKPVCTLVEDRLKLWIDMADTIVSMGCLSGDYEPSETRFVRDALSPGDTFLDIGANIGWFSILAADRVGPAGRVHAFEPSDVTRGLLERSVADNDFTARVTVHATALGAEDGVGRLIWSPEARSHGGMRLEGAEGVWDQPPAEQSVAVASLDGLGLSGPVKLIKMDVEGAEPMVLRGGRDLIARDRPLILIEVFEDLLRIVSRTDVAGLATLIRELDYRVHALVDGVIGEPIEDMTTVGVGKPSNVVLVPA